MDFKQIQELIKMVNKSNIGEVTVELKDFRVTIKQKEDKVQQVISAPMQMRRPRLKFIMCLHILHRLQLYNRHFWTESTKEAALYMQVMLSPSRAQ